MHTGLIFIFNFMLILDLKKGVFGMRIYHSILIYYC